MKTWILQHDNTADFSDYTVAEIEAPSLQRAFQGFLAMGQRFRDFHVSKTCIYAILWDSASSCYVDAWIMEKD